MDKLLTMISSTSEMFCERAVLQALFSKYEYARLVGSDPFNENAVGSNPHTQTIQLAQNCNLYFLLLGKSYGFTLDSTKKSATETEFDAAFSVDPTKILVFQKANIKPEPRQKLFIQKVTDYFSGYWRTVYHNLTEFQEIADKTFVSWMLKRAALPRSFTYIEHFVRECLQIASFDLIVHYHIGEEYVGYSIQYHNKEKELHFQQSEIRRNFWKCVSEFREKSEALIFA